MANNMAKKYYKLGKSRGMILDELKSSAYLALCEAAEKFDESKRVKFQTFAYPFIKGQILKDINNIQVFDNLEDCLNVVTEEQVVNNDEMWQTVNLGIDTILTPRECKVIKWKYGIDTNPLTCSEIARKLHLSKDDIMRLHKSAYDKLKKYSKNYKFNNI